MRALSIASTGMLAQQTNVEVIANNLANMNTTGFKEQRAEFQTCSIRMCRRPAPRPRTRAPMRPTASRSAPASRPRATYRITTQGDLTSTSNPYDVAIQGPGYFRIQQADGTDGYTRAGNFSLSPQGQIVTQDGMVVQPGIAIPANTISVTHQCPGPGQCHGGGQRHAPDGGPAGTDALSQRSGPERRWRQHVPGDRRLPARPRPAFPARPATAPSSRAFWKPPTSIRWTRSPP